MNGPKLLVVGLVATIQILVVARPSYGWEVPEAITVSEVGGLSPEALAAVEKAAGLVGAKWTVMDGGMLRLLGVTRDGVDVQRPPPGFGYPMAVTAVDVSTATDLLGAEYASVLRRGEAVMSRLSAGLRGAEVGDLIELEGWNGAVATVRIGAVAPDPDIGWQEIVIPAELAERLGFSRPARAVLWEAADRGLLRLALETFLPEGPIDVEIPGEGSPNRDETLPQVLVKLRFGEFSFAFTGDGDRIDVEDRWEEENIVLVDDPRLGTFPCNRKVVPYLRAALADVARLRLDWLLDRADFQAAGGCYNPRLMRGSDQGFALSRHAWGIAVDVNPSTNPYGGPVRMDPRIGNSFRRWGFAWGAGWRIPDGMHFEWVNVPLDQWSNYCSFPGPLLDWSAFPRAEYARLGRCALS